jgi:murein DD-endopeptidase MepM/ murein hydrolase activator NlpD
MRGTRADRGWWWALTRLVIGAVALGGGVLSGPVVAGPIGVPVGMPAEVSAEVSAPWVWPSGSDVVVSGWDPPASEYGPGHRGIDVRAIVGDVAVAVDAGVVTFAGPVAGRPVVTIDHGGGLLSTLDAVAPSVAAGDEVARGAPIGTVAAGSVSAGHCAGDPCLHVGARLDGEYVDPLRYLGRPAWPVLLPLP